jgi:proteic killer suppression protein
LEVNNTVEVDFADRALERLSASSAAMTREFGALRARRLSVRLAALRAVDYAVDLLPLPGRWHVLTGDWKGHMSGDLDQPYRLLVRPQEPAPLAEDGGVDWNATKAMTVVGILDTH